MVFLLYVSDPNPVLHGYCRFWLKATLVPCFSSILSLKTLCKRSFRLRSYTFYLSTWMLETKNLYLLHVESKMSPMGFSSQCLAPNFWQWKLRSICWWSLVGRSHHYWWMLDRYSLSWFTMMWWALLPSTDGIAPVAMPVSLSCTEISAEP